VDIKDESRVKGLKIKDIQGKTSVTALALQKQGRALIPNPAGDEVVEAGDQLIVIGTRPQLISLEKAL